MTRARWSVARLAGATAVLAATACGRVGFGADLGRDGGTRGDGGPRGDGGTLGDGATVDAAPCSNPNELAGPFGNGGTTPGWTPSMDAPVTIAEVGGDLTFTLGNASGYGRYSSTCAYDFSNARLAVIIAGTPTVSPGVEMYFELTDGTHFFGLDIKDGMLISYTQTDATFMQLAAVAFDAVADKHLQLRSTGFTTFWESSPDGVAWTTQLTGVSPFDLTHVNAGLSAGNFQAVAGPGSATFGAVDTP